MRKILFKKRDKIIQLENQIYGLRQRLERQDFSYQLTVPVITLDGEPQDIRFSGSPEAIASLQKSFDMRYKKRLSQRTATKPKAKTKPLKNASTPSGESI